MDISIIKTEGLDSAAGDTGNNSDQDQKVESIIENYLEDQLDESTPSMVKFVDAGTGCSYRVRYRTNAIQAGWSGWKPLVAPAHVFIAGSTIFINKDGLLLPGPSNSRTHKFTVAESRVIASYSNRRIQMQTMGSSARYMIFIPDLAKCTEFCDRVAELLE